MKQKTVSVQIPEPMDNYFAEDARQRLTTKASVLREVLLDHVKAHAPELLEQLQSAKPEPQAA